MWTKRIGNSPRIKLLLLHGGPGITHEYLEPCDSWLPAAGVEQYYYYDQLGSHYSDQPDDPDLRTGTAAATCRGSTSQPWSWCRTRHHGRPT